VASLEEEVEMGLLAGAEHASESSGEEEGDDSDPSVGGNEKMKAPLTREDKKGMALLIVLCASSSRAGIHAAPFFFGFR
jgi:hypothetical protein